MTRRRRREFLGTLAMACLAGCGFQRGLLGSPPGRVARVGFLALDRVPAARVEAFRGGLQDRGWTEGQNLIIDERYGGGVATRLADGTVELIGLGAEVLVGPGGLTTRIARDVTSTLPIVMATGATPVEEGLVSSLARPGGNVTGLTIGGPHTVLNGSSS
jgi:putative ABC transport system substrate-binding protein